MAETTNTLEHRVLRLYVSGWTHRSRQAIAHAKAVLNTGRLQGYTLEVIDILEDRVSAQRDGVIATPTLLITGPGSPRKIIGDLEDAEKVMAGLGLA